MKEMTWSDFIEAHCPMDGSKCGKGSYRDQLGCENCFNEFTKEYFLKDSDWMLALSVVGAAVNNRIRLAAAMNYASEESRLAARVKMQENVIAETVLALEIAKHKDSGCFLHEPPESMSCKCNKKSFFPAELIKQRVADRALRRATRTNSQWKPVPQDDLEGMKGIVWGDSPIDKNEPALCPECGEAIDRESKENISGLSAEALEFVRKTMVGGTE